MNQLIATITTGALLLTAGFVISQQSCSKLRSVDPAGNQAITSDSHQSTEGAAEARISLLDDVRLESVRRARRSDTFPNIKVMDQNGQYHEFYEDLVKDRTVCIVFFYTRCTGSCPGTTRTLERLRHELAGEFGSDTLRFISLTLEPDVDTPQELQDYMKRYRLDPDPSLPEWYYCTGDYHELDNLRRALGVFDPDPIIDADKTEHAAIITFGNDRLDRWAAMPTELNMSDLTETFVRIAGNTQRQRFRRVLLTSAGIDEAPKSSKCGCCQKSGTSGTDDCCASKIPATKPECCQTADGP